LTEYVFMTLRLQARSTVRAASAGFPALDGMKKSPPRRTRGRKGMVGTDA
jgi:hypothetical protein